MILGGATNLLVVLLLTGLAGSLSHCIGMCGPLVILAGARYSKQGMASISLHLLYHSGRILVYALMGMVAGGLGAAFSRVAAVAHIPGILSILMGMVVIIAGLSYLGWLPFWKRTLHPNDWWQHAMRRAMKTPGLRGVFLLGMLNGLLPCGLVYEALSITVASAQPLLAGLGMLVFGVATIPSLVIIGVGAQFLTIGVRQRLVWIGGVFVVVVGIVLIVRGAMGLGIFPSMMPSMSSNLK